MVNIFRTIGEPVVQEKTIELEHLKEVVINSDITNVVLLVCDQKQVHLMLETFKGGPELKLHLVNGRLEIDVKLQEKINIIQIRQEVSELTIHLPRNFADRYLIQSSVGNIKIFELTFQQLEMKTGAGDIKVKQVEAESISMESGAGNIKLNEVSTKKLFALSGAGNIKGKDCRGSVTVKSGAGNIDFHADGRDDLSLKSGAGNISVYLPDTSTLNATLKANAGIGKVRTDLPEESKKASKLSKVLGEGLQKLRFKTGVGNISIYKGK